MGSRLMEGDTISHISIPANIVLSRNNWSNKIDTSIQPRNYVGYASLDIFIKNAAIQLKESEIYLIYVASKIISKLLLFSSALRFEGNKKADDEGNK